MKITRSYTRKLNTGNYETQDFYCEMEQECKAELGNVAIMEVSGALHSFCKQEVEKSIEEYLHPRIDTEKVDKEWNQKKYNQDSKGQDLKRDLFNIKR